MSGEQLQFTSPQEAMEREEKDRNNRDRVVDNVVNFSTIFAGQLKGPAGLIALGFGSVYSISREWGAPSFLGAFDPPSLRDQICRSIPTGQLAPWQDPSCPDLLRRDFYESLSQPSSSTVSIPLSAAASSASVDSASAQPPVVSIDVEVKVVCPNQRDKTQEISELLTELKITKEGISQIMQAVGQNDDSINKMHKELIALNGALKGEATVQTIGAYTGVGVEFLSHIAAITGCKELGILAVTGSALVKIGLGLFVKVANPGLLIFEGVTILLGLFNTGPSFEEIVLERLKQISDQINKVNENIQNLQHELFHIHRDLMEGVTTILKSLHGGLTWIHESLSGQIGDFRLETLSRLNRIENKIDALGELMQIANFKHRTSKLKKAADYVDSFRRTSQSCSLNDFDEYKRILMKWVCKDAADSILNGKQYCDITNGLSVQMQRERLGSPNQEIPDLKMHLLIQYFSDVLMASLGKSQGDRPQLPNLLVWFQALQKLLELKQLYPQYEKKYEAIPSLNQIVDYIKPIDAWFKEISGEEYFKQLLANYRSKLKKVEDRIKTAVGNINTQLKSDKKYTYTKSDKAMHSEDIPFDVRKDPQDLLDGFFKNKKIPKDIGSKVDVAGTDLQHDYRDQIDTNRIYQLLHGNYQSPLAPYLLAECLGLGGFQVTNPSVKQANQKDEEDYINRTLKKETGYFCLNSNKEYRYTSAELDGNDILRLQSREPEYWGGFMDARYNLGLIWAYFVNGRDHSRYDAADFTPIREEFQRNNNWKFTTNLVFKSNPNNSSYRLLEISCRGNYLAVWPTAGQINETVRKYYKSEMDRGQQVENIDCWVPILKEMASVVIKQYWKDELSRDYTHAKDARESFRFDPITSLAPASTEVMRIIRTFYFDKLKTLSKDMLSEGSDFRTLLEELDAAKRILEVYLYFIGKAYNSEQIRNLTDSQKIINAFQEQFIDRTEAPSEIAYDNALLSGLFSGGDISLKSIESKRLSDFHPQALLRAGKSLLTFYKVDRLNMEQFRPDLLEFEDFKVFLAKCIQINAKLFEGEVFEWLRAILSAKYRDSRYLITSNQVTVTNYGKHREHIITWGAVQAIESAVVGEPDGTFKTEMNGSGALKSEYVVLALMRRPEDWRQNIGLLFLIAKALTSHFDSKPINFAMWLDSLLTYLYLLCNVRPTITETGGMPTLEQEIDALRDAITQGEALKSSIYAIGFRAPDLFLKLFGFYIGALITIKEYVEHMEKNKTCPIHVSSLESYRESEYIKRKNELTAYKILILNYLGLLYPEYHNPFSDIAKSKVAIKGGDELHKYLEKQDILKQKLSEGIQDYIKWTENLTNYVITYAKNMRAICLLYSKIKDNFDSNVLDLDGNDDLYRGVSTKVLVMCLDEFLNYHRKVSTLSFDNVPFDAEGLEELALMLLRHDEVVNLSIVNAGITLFFLDKRSLSSLKHLKHLNLSGNGFGGSIETSPARIGSLYRLLDELPNLEELNLSGNNFGNYGFALMVLGLSNWRKLTSLDFSRNKIDGIRSELLKQTLNFSGLDLNISRNSLLNTQDGYDSRKLTGGSAKMWLQSVFPKIKFSHEGQHIKEGTKWVVKEASFECNKSKIKAFTIFGPVELNAALFMAESVRDKLVLEQKNDTSSDKSHKHENCDKGATVSVSTESNNSKRQPKL